MTGSRARNEPPSSDPNIAHIVRMIEEERQANLAVVQHLVQATNQGRIAGMADVSHKICYKCDEEGHEIFRCPIEAKRVKRRKKRERRKMVQKEEMPDRRKIS